MTAKVIYPSDSSFARPTATAKLKSFIARWFAEMLEANQSPSYLDSVGGL